ncbi:DUF4297 family anti-phage-associated protein [Pseudomonas nicosulfuronedens]
MDRSAVDTIRGYFYQFDLSILSVLQLPDLDDTIEIECTEDIDIRTADDATAMQCKYYAKTEYNHSVIKDAVKHMASHFKETLSGAKSAINYSIKGYYSSGQEKLDGGVDRDFLKKHFLTYKKDNITHYHHEELGLTDADLDVFLTRLKINVRAQEFEAQYGEVLQSLRGLFQSSAFSAEYFYYNNALSVIRDLSIQAAAADRLISKRVFLERINTADLLFNEWFVQRKGKKDHLAALRRQYFTAVNVSPFERFFLIEVDPGSYVRGDVKDLVHDISRKWSKLSAREPSPFCPYVYIHGIVDAELLELKKELLAEGFRFIDGHDFHGAEFDCQSILQQATHGNGIRLKFLNTIGNLVEAIGVIRKTRQVFQFHIEGCYFELENAAVKHVRIQVEQLLDVKSII